jgi:hypothetical protein
MLFVSHAIDAAFRYKFSGSMFGFHNCFPEIEMLSQKRTYHIRIFKGCWQGLGSAKKCNLRSEPNPALDPSFFAGQPGEMKDI